MLIAVGGAFAACQDKLDLLPTSIVEDDYFTSADNAYKIVIGCYDVTAWEGADQIGVNTFFGDILGRDTYKGGSNELDQSWMNPFINFDYDPNISIINDVWTTYYLGIGRCNKALKYLPTMEGKMSPDSLNLYIAEVHFIRGYFYFQLAQQFGNVPLVDHLLNPDEYTNFKKSPQTEILKFVVSEMNSALSALPDPAKAEFGRANKGMAMAFKAKALLYAKNWAELETVTDTLIAKKWYELELKYEDLFKLENEQSKEIIYSTQYYTTGDPKAYGNDNEGSQIGIFLFPRQEAYKTINGWGFSCPTKAFADAFETGDLRREATILYRGETLWTGTPDEYTFKKPWATNVDGMNTQKYILPKSQRPASDYDFQLNWIQIRYAEVLLWNAEAKYYQGGDWKKPLNDVRKRAGLGDVATNADINAIYQERHVELGLEGHRFWDVVRQGRGEEVFGKYGFVEGENNFLPIPATQVNLNGEY